MKGVKRSNCQSSPRGVYKPARDSEWSAVFEMSTTKMATARLILILWAATWMTSGQEWNESPLLEPLKSANEGPWSGQDRQLTFDTPREVKTHKSLSLTINSTSNNTFVNGTGEAKGQSSSVICSDPKSSKCNPLGSSSYMVRGWRAVQRKKSETVIQSENKRTETVRVKNLSRWSPPKVFNGPGLKPAVQKSTVRPTPPRYMPKGKRSEDDPEHWDEQPEVAKDRSILLPPLPPPPPIRQVLPEGVLPEQDPEITKDDPKDRQVQRPGTWPRPLPPRPLRQVLEGALPEQDPEITKDDPKDRQGQRPATWPRPPAQVLEGAFAEQDVEGAPNQYASYRPYREPGWKYSDSDAEWITGRPGHWRPFHPTNVDPEVHPVERRRLPSAVALDRKGHLRGRRTKTEPGSFGRNGQQELDPDFAEWVNDAGPEGVNWMENADPEAQPNERRDAKLEGPLLRATGPHQ